MVGRRKDPHDCLRLGSNQSTPRTATNDSCETEQWTYWPSSVIGAMACFESNKMPPESCQVAGLFRGSRCVDTTPRPRGGPGALLMLTGQAGTGRPNDPDALTGVAARNKRSHSLVGVYQQRIKKDATGGSALFDWPVRAGPVSLRQKLPRFATTWVICRSPIPKPSRKL